jgi:phage shock protein A
MAELNENSVESRMLEVEQASMNSEAQARLAQIRSQLGLGAGEQAAPSDATSDSPGTPSPGTA